MTPIKAIGRAAHNILPPNLAASAMRSDDDIKRDVEAELRSDPKLDATDIAVAVKNGIVTLSGFVRRYPDKFDAEDAAKRVAGVIGLVNLIEVRLPGKDVRPDPEVARDAVAAIRNNMAVPLEQIRLTVKDGGSGSKAKSSGTTSATGWKGRSVM